MFIKKNTIIYWLLIILLIASLALNNFFYFELENEKNKFYSFFYQQLDILDVNLAQLNVYFQSKDQVNKVNIALELSSVIYLYRTLQGLSSPLNIPTEIGRIFSVPQTTYLYKAYTIVIQENANLYNEDIINVIKDKTAQIDDLIAYLNETDFLNSSVKQKKIILNSYKDNLDNIKK